MATLSVRPPARQHGLVRASSRRAGILTLALLWLLFVCLLSLAVGSRPIGLGTSIDALTHYDASNPDHVIVHDVRVPRTLIGLMVGTALGLAGALMQGVTRNPLADPGLLGVTAGAATAIAVAVLVIGVGPLAGYVWFAFAGAALGVVVVYGIASFGRDGPTPIKLALSGAAVTALFTSAAGKQDVAVVAVGGFEDGLYFARPARFPALKEYQGWGVNFVDTGVRPRNSAKKFDPADFWTVVSYERADAFPADLIMHDVQSGSLTLDALAKKPTWRSLPAVKAGQLVEWQKVQAWSYPLYTKEIELLTAGLERADAGLAT